MKKRRQQMSVQDIPKALELNKAKFSIRQIAIHLRVDHSTISRWLKKAKKLDLSTKKSSELTDEELHALMSKKKGPKSAYSFAFDAQSLCEAVANGQLTVQEAYINYLRQSIPSGLSPLKRSAFYQRVKK